MDHVEKISNDRRRTVSQTRYDVSNFYIRASPSSNTDAMTRELAFTRSD